MSMFTEEELEELRIADALIDAEFEMTEEEWLQSDGMDDEARAQRLSEREKKKRSRKSCTTSKTVRRFCEKHGNAGRKTKKSTTSGTGNGTRKTAKALRPGSAFTKSSTGKRKTLPRDGITMSIGKRFAQEPKYGGTSTVRS